MTWAALIEQWAALEYSWYAAFSERLSRVWASLSWREFHTMVGGLILDETLLAAQFRPKSDPEPEPDTEEDA